MKCPSFKETNIKKWLQMAGWLTFWAQVFCIYVCNYNYNWVTPLSQCIFDLFSSYFSHDLFQALKKDYRMTLVHAFDHLVLFQHLCWQHLIQEKNVNTTSEPKPTNPELLETDNTEKSSDYTKEDDSENPKKLMNNC